MLVISYLKASWQYHQHNPCVCANLIDLEYQWSNNGHSTLNPSKILTSPQPAAPQKSLLSACRTFSLLDRLPRVLILQWHHSCSLRTNKCWHDIEARLDLKEWVYATLSNIARIHIVHPNVSYPVALGPWSVCVRIVSVTLSGRKPLWSLRWQTCYSTHLMTMQFQGSSSSKLTTVILILAVPGYG